MELETLTPDQKLTAMWKDIDEKVLTLSTGLKRTVYPIVVQDVDTPGEYVIGYAFKPDMITQCRLIDRSADSMSGINIEACVTAMEALIIPGESDPRFTDKTGENHDLYFKGAAYTLKQYMSLAIPVLKKK